MDTVALCERLQSTTYLVFVLLGSPDGEPELLGSGSAVAVNSRGDLLTAAHVVTTRLPIRLDDLQDPNLIVLAKSVLGSFRRYSSPLCGLSVNLGGLLSSPLTVDLAVLQPVEGQSNVQFLPLSAHPPVVGEQVLMAGYPDDIELPFCFDQLLLASTDQNQAGRVGLEIARRLMMVRSGMIGHSASIKINEEYAGHSFHIDNVLHSGASGGPVLNSDGELLGILTKRAITRVPYEDTPSLRVPSGAAVAITPHILMPKLRELGVIPDHA
jgi:hypothetical protein